jgi:predicted SnoaL-like aldol condensation-catalyzing enzyme
MSNPAENKALVVKAINELFGNRDVSALDRYWSTEYIQHDPHAPNGTGGLRALVEGLGESFKLHMGMVVADGDIVMVHARYEGDPTLIAAEIYRIEDGKIAEHWDVLQPEVTDTASGNPMFSLPAQAAAA